MAGSGRLRTALVMAAATTTLAGPAAGVATAAPVAVPTGPAAAPTAPGAVSAATPQLTIVRDTHAMVRTSLGFVSPARTASPRANSSPRVTGSPDAADDTDSPRAAVSAGAAHTCAIGPFGDLWCFGDDSAGQLGTPTAAGAGGTALTVTEPVRVVVGVLPAGGTVAVQAGRGHTCALSGDTVYCWGDNDEGQVGDGTTTDRTRPVRILADAVRIAAGREHTCALLTAGDVYCWGDNDAGQLGTGDVDDRQDMPQPVSDLGEVVDIAAGGDTTCAVDADGAAWCWGSDADGQAGDGGAAAAARSAPVAVETDDIEGGVVAVTVGRRHACALGAEHTVHCWGSDASGQLGTDPDPGPDSHHGPEPEGGTADERSPVPVSGTESFDSVDAGGDTTCAVTTTGQGRCWGANGDGQLGTGARDARGAPAAVDLGAVRPSPVTALFFGSDAPMLSSVSVGDAHTCATDVQGGVYCWGSNATGQLGTGRTGTGQPGTGMTGGTDVPTATRLIPDPAADVRATAADGALVVAWTPPTVTGAAPVAEHAALAVADNGLDALVEAQVCRTTSARGCRLDNLSNRRRYDLLVGTATAAGLSFSGSAQGVPGVRAEPAPRGADTGVLRAAAALAGHPGVGAALIVAGLLGLFLGRRRLPLR